MIEQKKNKSITHGDGWFYFFCQVV